MLNYVGMNQNGGTFVKRQIIKCMIIISCLCLLAGCAKQPEPTQPVTTVPPTTQVPTTEATTVPPTTEAPALPLEMVQPLETELVTIEETLLFAGMADPRYCVEINGQTVQPGEDGSFSCELALEVGENTVTVTYLDEVRKYTVTRRYTTAWYAHAEGTTCCRGASVYEELYAREGS